MGCSSRYKLGNVIKEDERMRMYCATDAVSNKVVFLKCMRDMAMDEEDRMCVVKLLRHHPLNHSPYVLSVVESFWEDEELFVMQRYMNTGDVGSILSKTSTVSDDFVLYVFMQVVYAIKMHKEETWFWDSVCTDDIWVDSMGKVRICWCETMLSDPRQLSSMLEEWKERVQCYDLECADESSSGEMRCRSFGRGVLQEKRDQGLRGYEDEYVVISKFGSLRRIFVELMFRPKHGHDEMLRELKDVVEEGAVFSTFNGVKVSETMRGFIELLFKNGRTSFDLEKYVKKAIQEKRIVSDPQKIFGSLDLRRKKVDISGSKVNLDAEEENSVGHEEGGLKIRHGGTREYKKGRFHVCDTISPVEREKDKDTQAARRMFRAIEIQSQQINILMKAVKAKEIDKLMESKLMDLEDQMESVLMGFEGHK